MKQKAIQFNSMQEWCDVEAGEVDLGKQLSEESHAANWKQWGGIVERGQPHTLALFRLNPLQTKPRSPHPRAHPAEGLETDCMQVPEESQCHSARRWCQGVQNADPRCDS